MDMSIPKVSIIVPAFNAQAYLHQCMDSLLSQSLKDIEIICVNDGSTDATAQILADYARKDQRVRIVNKENAGVSEARNSGLDLAVGEYIMFVDSDDWIDAEMCRYMYQQAHEHNADCVMCSYEKMFEDHSVVSPIFEQAFLEWGSEEIQKNIHLTLFGPVGEQLRFPERGDVLATPCMQLFRRECFGDIRFYDIRKIGSFEDGLYQIAVYQKCSSFVYINQPYYKYRKTNSDSITTKFRPQLPAQWKNLFTIMRYYIAEHNLGESYQEALNNRICLSMIGLGLNQISSDLGFFRNAQAIHRILSYELYRRAYERLDFRWFPIHWKCFFILCKWRCAPLVVVLLRVMNFIRYRGKRKKRM